MTLKLKLSTNARRFAAGSLASVVVALALAPFNMGGCSAGNMDVGKMMQGTTQLVQTSQLSEKDEDVLGQNVALTATNRWRIYPDAELNRYVTLVGRTVATGAPRNSGYGFAVLDSDDANAFSGPAGYVFITRGAIARMHDESELAGVLAHEIGHVCKHHGLNAVRTANTGAGLSKIGQGAAAGGGNGDQMNALINASDSLSGAIIDTGFGQPQEEEADHEGVKYLIAARYNPDGYLHYIQRLAADQGKGGKPFGTHPGMGDRAKKVAEQIRKAGKGGQGATLAERFHQFVTFAK